MAEARQLPRWMEDRGLTAGRGMTAEEASGRIAFLVAEINRHDRLYYVEAKPVIGDRDYDLLY